MPRGWELALYGEQQCLLGLMRTHLRPGGPACLGSFLAVLAPRTPDWKGSFSMLGLQNIFPPLQTCPAPADMSG